MYQSFCENPAIKKSVQPYRIFSFFDQMRISINSLSKFSQRYISNVLTNLGKWDRRMKLAIILFEDVSDSLISIIHDKKC
jgi:hypothetical protein